MTKINPKKMKVAELKAELEARDIEFGKGLKKADLIAMLMSAMESEVGTLSESMMSEEDAETEEPAATEDKSQEVPPVPEANEPEQIAEDPTPAEIINEPEQEEKPAEEAEPVAEVETPAEEAEPVAEVEKPVEEAEPAADSEQAPEEPTLQQESSDAVQDDVLAGGDAPAAEQAATEQMETNDAEPAAVAEEESSTKDEPDAKEPTGTNAEQMETDKNEADKKGDQEKVNGAAAAESEKKETKNESRENESHSRKRRYDDERRQRYEERYAPPPEEPEEEFDDTLVVFDKYNSDLNMKFPRDRLTAHPMSMESFGYLWASVKATYGAKSGKVCFECKCVEEHSVRHLPSDEPNSHLVRVGWSPNSSTTLLGEEELSFACCGTGKKVHNATCEDYGESFKEGDVIGCYLDLTGEESFVLSYTKNGKSLGVAFTEEKSKLGENALFPHIISRNTTVECNFGAKENPHFPHPEEFSDYVFLANVPLEERIRATVGPSAKKECEVLMLCGLPGAGKTFFANKHTKENPDKKYNILGASHFLTRMKVSGIAQKSGRHAARDTLEHAGNCLGRLLSMACRKKRNFILDQGFQRKAVVVVPTDEEFKSRVDKQTKDEGKEIPDIALYEMKAGFSMPEQGDLFEEIVFAELDKEEAAKQIEKYKEEAKKQGPPPEKRFRGGYDSGRNMGRGSWGGSGGGYGSRDNMMPRMPFNRGGGRGFGGSNYNRYGGGSGGGGGQGGYGSRDNNRSGYGNDRRNFGSQGGGGGYNKGGNNWQNRGFGGGGGRQNQGSYGGNRSASGASGGGASGGGASGGGASGGGASGGGGGYNRNNSGARSGTNNRSVGGAGGGYQQNRHMGGSNYQAKNQQQQQTRPQRNQNTPYNYHQAYQQQTAQLAASSTSNQATSQQPQAQASAQAYQAYGAQGQTDYSQQWAQYYQQQAAQQQQQQAAAAAAQYQNYYAYQQAYGGQGQTQ